jgi:hemerythrin-like domain-containing protein
VADPITFWHEEHAYFNRLLDSLHRQADRFPAGERPNYELMLDIISYLRDYGDAFHHPREDAAFDRLLKRCPELALPLARLKRDHRVIARAGETLRKDLEAVLDGTIVPVKDLEVSAATYLVYYGNHIAREEEDILPRAAQVLTPEDWQTVTAAVPPRSDPLFGEHPEERFRELRRQIALEV